MGQCMRQILSRSACMQEVQERDIQQRQNIADLVGVVDKLEGEMKELKTRTAKLESAKKAAEQEAAEARKANRGLGVRK